MTWVFLFALLGLFALVGAVAYAVWLWRRAGALLSEVGRLAACVDEAARLAEQVGSRTVARPPEPMIGPRRPAD